MRADRIQLRRLHSLHGAAALAMQIFPLAAPDELVEAGTVTEVDMTREPVALERFEIAVHGGEVETDSLRDALRGQEPVRREERLEHESTRGGEAESAPAERPDGAGQISEHEP